MIDYNFKVKVWFDQNDMVWYAQCDGSVQKGETQKMAIINVMNMVILND